MKNLIAIVKRLGIGSFLKVKKLLIDNKLNAYLLLIVFVLLLMWDFSWLQIILATILFLFISYDWDSRVVVVPIVGLVISYPIFFLVGKNNLAEQMMIYAVYLFIIVLILQIIEYHRHARVYQKVSRKR